MKYDIEGNGVIDLVKLLRDVLDIRNAAMHMAIDQRDVELAYALDNGIDAEIHRLIGLQLEVAQKEAEAAHVAAFETPDTFVNLIENLGAHSRAEMYVQAIEGVYRTYGEAIQAMTGLHPLLFEQATPDLLQLLKEQEEKQQEQDRVEAKREAAASATATS